MADFNADFRSGGSQLLLIQNPVAADYYSSASFTVAANIRYYQRVFDTGTGGWCYYSTLNILNSSPASAATSPNWTGTISNHQVLTRLVEY
jgi:hypothetical protein